MGIKFVPGKLGEMVDLVQSDRSRARDHAVTDPKLGQRLAERVLSLLPWRTSYPATRDRAEHLRTGLNGGALHVVQDAADAAHLLAAASPARPAVDERRQRRTVPGRLAGVIGVEHEQPTVPRRDAK